MDACASLGLQGALMHLEDLVRHDAAMDLRAPTPDLTRAHAVLRTRRSIARGSAQRGDEPGRPRRLEPRPDREGGGASGDGIAVIDEPTEDKAGEGAFDDDAFAAELAAIDAVLERSSRALAGAVPPARRTRSPSFTISIGTRAPALSSGLAWPRTPARCRLSSRPRSPLMRGSPSSRCSTGLGSGAGGFGALRARGKARNHLPCLNGALRQLPHDRRRARDQPTRLVAFLEAVTLGAGQGIKDHDRWRLSRGCSNANSPGAENAPSCRP